MDELEGKGPLAGALVLDLTRYLPGPYATLLLADFGARVVKVEPPPGGDPVRAFPPFAADGASVSFRALNAGKRSLGLDLKQPGAADLLLSLVERADVLVEGFRPGVLERLGLGAAACQARNPRLVYCSISGYGQDGPYRDRAGHDVDYQAYSGVLAQAERPLTPGIQAGDLLASLSAACGVLLALLERARTGRGRVVDACMLDALVSTQGLHLLGHLAGQRTPPGGALLTGGVPCYRVYETADGRAVALGALEPKFWEAFCDVVDRPDWLARPMDAALTPEVAALFRTRPRDEWRVILEEAGCCLAPVLDYDEVAADPQVQARGLVGDGRLAPPVRLLPQDPLPPARAPARAGADTADVLREVLGLGASEVEDLARRGVVCL